MADRLNWLVVNAFPGIDEATSDHLLQPTGRRGPAVMRRMVSVNPFTQRGEFSPAAGFTQFYDVDASLGLHAHIEDEATQLFAVNSAGQLLQLSGGSWGALTSDHLPFDITSSRVRFCTGYDALFIVDGKSRPKVLGWNYDAGDATVEWDSQQLLAEILYTYGQKSTPTDSDDDFYAEGCCFHANRLMLWMGNEVRASAPYTPTVFYKEDVPSVAQSWFQAEDGSGLDISTAWSFDNQMFVVALPHSLHGYVGSDPASSYSHVSLDAGRGVYAKNSVALGSGRAWFCAEDGPCSVDMKNGVKFIGEEIQNVWDELTYQQKQAVTGWWEDGMYHICLPVAFSDVDGTIPDEAAVQYVYDPITKRWAHWWGVSGNHEVIKPVDSEAYAIAHSAADGTDRLYKMNTGTDLDGETIVNELVTPWLEFWEPFRDKWIREIRIELVQGPDTIDVAIARNYEETFEEETHEAKPPDDSWTDASAGMTSSTPRWLPVGDPNGIFWNAPGGYVIQLPVSIHCEALKLRLRGEGLKVKSIGFGFAYERT